MKNLVAKMKKADGYVGIEAVVIAFVVIVSGGLAIAGAFGALGSEVTDSKAFAETAPFVWDGVPAV